MERESRDEGERQECAGEEGVGGVGAWCLVIEDTRGSHRPLRGHATSITPPATPLRNARKRRVAIMSVSSTRSRSTQSNSAGTMSKMRVLRLTYSCWRLGWWRRDDTVVRRTTVVRLAENVLSATALLAAVSSVEKMRTSPSHRPLTRRLKSQSGSRDCV